METIIERIKRHEGLKLKQYRCPAGKLTIGYGHNLDAKGRMGLIPAGRDLAREGITLAEAEALLQRDISDAMADLRGVFKWFDTAPQSVQDVLLDMCFNMGLKGLLKFHNMLAEIVAGNYQTAADELKNSAYYHQVGDRAKENEEILRGVTT